jgi:biotin carboxylase
MNLLVTNTRAAQAYSIIRALRPYAQKIVVTMYGKNLLTARLSHAANSRLVDKRYYVPSPAGNWRKGRIGKQNTQSEEAYIQEVLRICEIERIDTVFPSWDPQIYVLSKNKERFERIGVLIPIPDYETLIIPLDKYRTILAAQEAGFSCPRTYLPHGLEDLGRIMDDLSFPVMIKPRFTSWGIEIVRDRSALLEKTFRLAENYGMPMIQEFIPGGQRQDLHFLLDKGGELKLAFHRSIHRTFRVDPHAHFSTVNESTDPHPYVLDAMRFVQKLGWWGSAVVETIVDPRDGKAKFIEFIPRFRRQLWNTTELGINEPWMCIKIARDEAVEPVKNYPLGIMFLNPIEDMLVLLLQLLDLLIYKFTTGVMRKAPIDPWNPPPPLKELLRSYTQAYFSGKQRLVDPYFRYFFQDPLVSILWWLQFSTWIFRLTRQLGR